MNIIMGGFYPQPFKTKVKQTVSNTIIPEIQNNINHQRLKGCLVKSSSMFNAALCCLTACVPTFSPPSKIKHNLNYAASHPTTSLIFYPLCLQHPPFLHTLISHLSMHRGGAGVCTRKHVHGQKRHGLLFYPDPSLSAGNSWHTTVGYCLCGCVCECVHVTTQAFVSAWINIFLQFH